MDTTPSSSHGTAPYENALRHWLHKQGLEPDGVWEGWIRPMEQRLVFGAILAKNTRAVFVIDGTARTVTIHSKRLYKCQWKPTETVIPWHDLGTQGAVA